MVQIDSSSGVAELSWKSQGQSKFVSLLAPVAEMEFSGCVTKRDSKRGF